MARITKSINKKRIRSANQENNLEETAREPQELALNDYLLNLYKSCNPSPISSNNESNSDDAGVSTNNGGNVILPPNVIVKTSFHEFQVHDFALKRSGLFRTMIDSNEQWKLGKTDGKFNIDLMSVEDSILPEQGEALNRKDFDNLFEFLYCDTIHATHEFEDVKRLVEIARYFDIPSLTNKILEENSKRDITRTEESYSDTYFQIKYMLKGELTENEIIQLVFLLFERTNDSYSYRKGTKRILAGPNELIDYICQKELVPLFIKVKLLASHLSQNKETDSTQQLQPFQKSITVMREEFKYLLKGQREKIEKDMVTLLQFDTTKDKNPCKTHNTYRCADITHIYMGSSEGEAERFTLWDNKVNIDVSCGERSSAYWWDFSFENHLASEEDFQLVNRTFYKTYVHEAYQRTEEVDICKKKELTIYAPQFDAGGMSANLLLYFERKN